MLIFKLRAKYKNENFYFYFDGEKFVSEFTECDGKNSYTLEKLDARLDWQLEALIGGGWMTVDKELIK